MFPKNTSSAANNELEKNPVKKMDKSNTRSKAALVPPNTLSKAANNATDVYLAYTGGISKGDIEPKLIPTIRPNTIYTYIM